MKRLELVLLAMVTAALVCISTAASLAGDDDSIGARRGMGGRRESQRSEQANPAPQERSAPEPARAPEPPKAQPAPAPAPAPEVRRVEEAPRVQAPPAASYSVETPAREDSIGSRRGLSVRQQETPAPEPETRRVEAAPPVQTQPSASYSRETPSSNSGSVGSRRGLSARQQETPAPEPERQTVQPASNQAPPPAHYGGESINQLISGRRSQPATPSSSEGIGARRGTGGRQTQSRPASTPQPPPPATYGGESINQLISGQRSQPATPSSSEGIGARRGLGGRQVQSRPETTPQPPPPATYGGESINQMLPGRRRLPVSSFTQPGREGPRPPSGNAPRNQNAWEQVYYPLRYRRDPVAIKVPETVHLNPRPAPARPHDRWTDLWAESRRHEDSKRWFWREYTRRCPTVRVVHETRYVPAPAYYYWPTRTSSYYYWSYYTGYTPGGTDLVLVYAPVSNATYQVEGVRTVSSNVRYVDETDDFRDYRWPSYTTDREEALSAARRIKQGWENGDIQMIAEHVSQDVPVRLYEHGEYLYWVSQREFQARIKESMTNEGTERFDIDRVVPIRPGEVLIYARHEQRDSGRSDNTLYERYTLERLGNDWVISAYETNTHKIVD